MKTRLRAGQRPAFAARTVLRNAFFQGTPMKSSIVRILCAFALLPSLAFATVPDLSAANFASTCATLPREARVLKNNAERQAFVICRDIETLQALVRFGKASANFSQDPGEQRIFLKKLRAQLVDSRERLQTVRRVLQQMKLQPGEGLLIQPSQWQVDLDGDGKLDTWEKYAFAIPKRGHQPLRLQAPSNSPGYYSTRYNLEAKIRVDQSDILWTLAYHCFVEALLEIVLAYHFESPRSGDDWIVLYEPEGMRRAHGLLVSGFKTSESMRRSVLAETDDEHEWISNPKQMQTVFPLPLDQQDFAIWGQLMSHIIPLFEGKTVLAAGGDAGGPLGMVAKLCPPQHGLSVPTFFRNPPERPLKLVEKLDLSKMCQPVGKKTPASGLFELLQAYARRADQSERGAMFFLRHLLWVN